jgi:hypothetical protein
MVARTLPFKSRDKPDGELPSISTEMQRQIEADQKDLKKQLKHAQQQIDLTKAYPGRKGGHPVNLIAVNSSLRLESGRSAALPRSVAMCH